MALGLSNILEQDAMIALVTPRIMAVGLQPPVWATFIISLANQITEGDIIAERSGLAFVSAGKQLMYDLRYCHFTCADNVAGIW